MNRIELLILAARVVGIFVAVAVVGWFVSRHAARNGSGNAS
jgi:hypothetical protein